MIMHVGRWLLRSRLTSCHNCGSKRVSGIGRARVLCAALIASLITTAGPLIAAAQNGTPTIHRPPVAIGEARQREAWRLAIQHTPLPGKGCFSAAYPATSWHAVQCDKPAPGPFRPARGVRPLVVGNGNDATAQSSATISSAVGSFDSVTGVTGEKDVGANNNYSLQLNSNSNLTTPLCNGAAVPKNCGGWQQFLFSNMPDLINARSSCTHFGGACVYMQYWLLSYGNSCPSGWQAFGSDCYRNSDNALSIDRVPIEDLGKVKLTGTAGGASDVVAFTSTDGIAYALSEDSFLSLNLSWQQTEFNVVGNCCVTQAGFNIGSTLVVRTSITDGTAQAPSCVTNGTTGETNNLTLFGPCTSSGGTSPAIVFTERFLGAAAAQQPISIVDYHNQQHFTYTAASGEIWDAYSCPDCEDAPWHLQKINDGGATTGPAAVSAPTASIYGSADQDHIAYLAGRGEIWDAFYCPNCSGGQWQLQKINLGGVTSGPAAVTSPSVEEYIGHNQDHFAYEAANGEIWDAYYCPQCSGTPWKLQKINLGGMTNAPASITQPVLSTYVGHDQEHFVYLAANGEIWDAFYCPNCSGNSWRSQKINLGGVTNGPAAVTAPFVDVYLEADQQHFAYLASNGEIWDAFWCQKCGSGQWKLQKINLGGVTNGPAATSRPSISEYLIGQPANGVHNQQHFAYATKGGDVWDAYYCPPCGGNGWKLQEITAGGVTSGPLAASSLPPSVSVFSEHDQQHFAYVTASGQIRDAWYCGNCGGSSWNLQQLAGP